ncbi:hypothetical protein [Bacillus massilinigeriensis]|uniref:hypothetical protein n=1 Tax=Bacillus massilionigeriensis TaxID=1805475 RepID=UPI00096AE7B4|nr:hypothetical protein [Bacillus massilionigeriensis]
MFLTNSDLRELFPQSKGFVYGSMSFQTVAFRSSYIQPKGLFIPVFHDSGELQEAIENGAIAALWDKNKDIPRYTPNDFPIFLTNDLLEGLMNMIKLYKNKIEENKTDKDEKTNFIFLEENLLNETDETYDIAVMAKKLKELIELDKQEGRE